MRPYALLIAATALLLLTACSNPQPQPAEKPAAPQAQIHGDLLQVMRGVLFPNSNVIFSVQGKNPAEIKSTAADPSTAIDPFQGPYGGWLAVENAGIALSESANLLTIPGRKCANGRPVPLDNPDWAMFVKELRDAGAKVTQAGQAKKEDAILDAADAVASACSNCHDKYREKPGGDKDRCS